MENQKMTMSIAEVCTSSGFSRPTIMAYINRSKDPLPCIKAGRRYMIPRAALEAWLVEEAARNTMSIGRPMVR